MTLKTTLTEARLAALPIPEKGYSLHHDSQTRGLAVRVAAGGTKAFVFGYRFDGRERRMTIGRWPEWRVKTAREYAAHLRVQIDTGTDPLEAKLEAREERAALASRPTVKDLCDALIADRKGHIRPATMRDYQSMVRKDVLPSIGRRYVEDVSFADLDKLHRNITQRGAPIVANRCLSMLRKAFAIAIRLGWRADNPAIGHSLNIEVARDRYLTDTESSRLWAALAAHPNQDAADAIRLLLLTGARKSEVLTMAWQHVDLQAGLWLKPATLTKQRKVHRCPLNATAIEILTERRIGARSDYVFPGRDNVPHRKELKYIWQSVLAEASIGHCRIHDLRHSFASMLASDGESLPAIGALLGHSSPQTTARYAHLFDEPLKRATEGVGARFTRAA